MSYSYGQSISQPRTFFYNLSQCFISIPPENIRTPLFFMFPGGIAMKHWLKMGLVKETMETSKNSYILSAHLLVQNQQWKHWKLTLEDTRTA